MENAVVALCPANGDPCDGDDANRDQTDADGTYLIENVAGGTYRVNIYLPELDFQRRAIDTVEIDATVQTRDFQLPTGSVDGAITHADGSAAQGVTVQVCGPIPTQDRFLWDCHAVTVQTDGSYELPYLIPGEWEFMLFFPSPVHENPRGYGQVSVLEAPVTRNVVLPAGSVAGTVELPDGEPAAGATVSLCGGGLSACIGGNTLDGAFSLKYLEPGEYTLTANPPYGRDDLRSVSTTVTVAADPVSVDLRLAVGASLSGRILNADGDLMTSADVAGVAVMNADMSSGWTAYFDAGEFTIQLEEDGVYAIVVYTQPDSVYDTTTVQNVTVTGPTTRDVVLDLRPTGGVTGTVYDSTGTDPQPYHEVWLCTDAQSGSCNWFTQSDGAGSYLFRFIPPGDYQVAVADPFTGQLTSVGDVTIADDIVQMDLILPAGPTGGLSGRVLDSEGHLVSGVYVMACLESCFSTSTGDDGAYELTGLPAGDYTVYVYPPQPYAFTSFTQTVGTVVIERDVTLDPVPTGGLAGYIRTNDGAAAPDVYITACNPNGACFQTPSGWGGAYQLLGLPAGWYRVALYDPSGVYTEVADPIYVADAVVEIDFDLPPVPTGGITGTVYTASGTLEYPQLYACGPSNCHLATSDEAGNYSLTSLASGEYFLHLAVESSWLTVGLVTVGLDIVTHDVMLPTGELNGYVRDSGDGATPVPNSWVQACDQAGYCYGAAADATGLWAIRYLPAGEYRLTAYPGSGEFLATTLDGTTAVDADAVSVDILLGRITPAPETVTMSGSGSIGSNEGVPVLLAGQPIELRVEACADATSASYEITSLYDSTQRVSGTMTEEAAGSHVFIASVELTFTGAGEVVITIAGCDPIEFNVYIDPSGWVYDTLGVPIVGADVVLLRSASADGPFEVVPDGSAIMSPSNRANPDVTDATGHFGWDVIAGYYKVQTSKPGCVSAADPSRFAAETRVYEIPPPVMDIDLRLNCGETSTVPGTDTTDPTITIAAPSEGATLILGDDISFECADDVGIASCVATVDGIEIATPAAATASVGQHTLAVTAIDISGNTVSAQRTYQVVYDFSGFFRPVDIATADGTPVFNRVKAGAGVPVKFTLNGDQGLGIFQSGSPSSVQVACNPSAVVDAIEQTVTTKGSQLTYDTATGQYTYTFRTDKQWAGTCRALTLVLDDGTVHRAYFTFP